MSYHRRQKHQSLDWSLYQTFLLFFVLIIDGSEEEDLEQSWKRFDRLVQSGDFNR